jgi:hypothetical protein
LRRRSNLFLALWSNCPGGTRGVMGAPTSGAARGTASASPSACSGVWQFPCAVASFQVVEMSIVWVANLIDRSGSKIHSPRRAPPATVGRFRGGSPTDEVEPARRCIADEPLVAKESTNKTQSKTITNERSACPPRYLRMAIRAVTEVYAQGAFAADFLVDARTAKLGFFRGRFVLSPQFDSSLSCGGSFSSLAVSFLRSLLSWP